MPPSDTPTTVTTTPPATPDDADREGTQQFEMLIAVALTLGGVALLQHSAGSWGKLLGGIGLAVAGALALGALFMERRRARKGVEARGRALVIKLVLYPIYAILVAVAVLAPFAIIGKLVLTLVGSHH